MATASHEYKGVSDNLNVVLWINKLQKSIEDGRCNDAAIWACKLALYKIKCYIAVETNLVVPVEKKDGVLGNISVSVHPRMSIRDLKEKVYFEHQFLPALQRWFFMSEMNTDDGALLSKYGINDSGEYHQDVHLYIRDKSEGVNGKSNSDESENETEEKQNDVRSNCEGWTCKACTYVNIPTRPGCEICSESRPDDYVIPDTFDIPEAEKERLRKEKENEQEVLAVYNPKPVPVGQSQILEEIKQLDDKPLIENDEPFECPVCFTEVLKGEGVKLRECFHTFCRPCLQGAIANSENACISCPYSDEAYSCSNQLLDREIKALSSPEVYEKYHLRSMSEAESANPNTFHCQTADCKGWCFYDDDVNDFNCPICRSNNCLTCRAIHEGKNCKQYQEWLQNKAQWDEDARKTAEAFEVMIQNGEAMRCPVCKVIIMKKGGCDWLCCSVCRLEICWVTRGPRWGPGGRHDTSGGCKCRVNGQLCHPKCQNCH